MTLPELARLLLMLALHARKRAGIAITLTRIPGVIPLLELCEGAALAVLPRSELTLESRRLFFLTTRRL